MKQLLATCVGILLLAVLAGLCQTAVNPEDFAGQWYSDDQKAYRFQEGLIYASANAAALWEDDSICGAYTYCRNSVFLFAVGIDGLETEQELYLVQKGEGSFLCEKEDGSGKIYFIRYHE